MQVIDRPLDGIRPYEDNPRNNDDAVDKVAESIQKFGFKVPIVIDSEGIIVAGHTRYKAAQKLGLEKIPCIVADDLTDAQVRAFRLVDNKVAEFSGWNFEKLGNELESLKELELDFRMENFGFCDATQNVGLDDMFDPAKKKPEKENEPKMTVCPYCGKEHEV